MNVVAIHVSDAYGSLLGSPGKAPDAGTVARAGANASRLLPGYVATVSDGFDRVLLVLDGADGWRKQLDPGHSEARDRWPAAAWAPLEGALVMSADIDRAIIIVPPLYPAGTLVPLGEDASGDGPDLLDIGGKRPAARDMLATVARVWRESHEARYIGAPVGGRLRIVSSRTSLACLADEAAGIELVRSVTPPVGSAGWTMSAPETRESLSESLDVPPEFVAQLKALAMLDGISDKKRKATPTIRQVRPSTAVQLLRAFGGPNLSALRVCQEAAKGTRLLDLDRVQMASLTAGAAHGGAMVLRALAVHELRSDVALDVGALLRHGGDDVRISLPGGDRDDDMPVQRRLLRGDLHRAEDLPQGERGADGGGPAGDPALRDGGGEQVAAPVAAPPRAPDATPHPPVPPAEPRHGNTAAPPGFVAFPGSGPICIRCAQGTGPDHGPDETCEAARARHVAERLTALATEPRDTDHGHAVVVTRSDGQQEAAHTPGADKSPPRGASAPQATATPPSPTREDRSAMTDQLETAAATYNETTGEEQPRNGAALARVEAPSVALARPADKGPPAMMSDDTNTLWTALYAAQAGFGEVVKTRAMTVRGEIRYHYANLSDVVNAVMPSLKANGFVCVHICRGNRLHVRLVHTPSGQWIEGVLPFVAPTVNGPEGVQALGSLLTYLRRYLLSMLLGVVAVDDDDDGVSAQRPAGRTA